MSIQPTIKLAWYKMQTACVNDAQPVKFQKKLDIFTGLLSQQTGSVPGLQDLKRRLTSFVNNPDMPEDKKQQALSGINKVLGLVSEGAGKELYAALVKNLDTRIQTLQTVPPQAAAPKAAPNAAEPADRLQALADPVHAMIDMLEKYTPGANKVYKEIVDNFLAFMDSQKTEQFGRIYQRFDDVIELKKLDTELEKVLLTLLCSCMQVEKSADPKKMRSDLQQKWLPKKPVSSPAKAIGKIALPQGQELATTSAPVKPAPSKIGSQSIRDRQASLFNKPEQPPVKRTLDPVLAQNAEKFKANREKIQQLMAEAQQKAGVQVAAKIQEFTKKKSEEFLADLKTKTVAADSEDGKEAIEHNQKCIANVKTIFEQNHIKKAEELTEAELEEFNKTQNLEILLKNAAGMTSERLLTLLYLDQITHVFLDLYVEMYKTVVDVDKQNPSSLAYRSYLAKREAICESLNYCSMYNDNAKEIATIPTCKDSEQRYRKGLLNGRYYMLRFLMPLRGGASQAVLNELEEKASENSMAGKAYIEHGYREVFKYMGEVGIKYRVVTGDMGSTAKPMNL